MIALENEERAGNLVPSFFSPPTVIINEEEPFLFVHVSLSHC